MTPVHLFDLAARHAQWTALRQVTISGNVANANTPGYEALDVAPFADVMDRTRLEMAAPRAGHIGTDLADTYASRVSPAESWEVTHSGNSVSVEQELIKADEVNRAYSLNTSIVSAFHRMVLSSTRVGA